ncbi:RHS repeat-associated core domain-containing protein [Pseudomonas sp. NPDC090233]|uniref:RHS repeat-associated core domain-containing protein n=1 Tax=Pseudomonas sp. NPDC090233 TaxID=3364479 RepID=UPI00383A9F76
MAWRGTYKAWGETEEKRTERAVQADIRNPLRFQGQYFDIETGLHYNRYRYYDPQIGRFISRDPIGLLGGLNAYGYAPNPIEWTDPYGLIREPTNAGRKPRSSKPNQNSRCPCRNAWEIKRYDRVCEALLNGTKVKYYRDPVRNNWWSRDTENHGGSAWKVMNQHGSELIHIRDADIYGDYMTKKHKGQTGARISMKGMKCKKREEQK